MVLSAMGREGQSSLGAGSYEALRPERHPRCAKADGEVTLRARQDWLRSQFEAGQR
jgi:hypothetical protein